MTAAQPSKSLSEERSQNPSLMASGGGCGSFGRRPIRRRARGIGRNASLERPHRGSERAGRSQKYRFDVSPTWCNVVNTRRRYHEDEEV
jgi:hypothetical protein